MSRSIPGYTKGLASWLALGLLAVFADSSQAQQIGQGGPAGGATTSFIRRSGGILDTRINFQQYGQVTGIGPTSGTVRIYNLFGVLNMQSAFGGAFGGSANGPGSVGGIGGGIGGIGGGIGGIGGSTGAGFQSSQGLVGSGITPGIGSSAQGDDTMPGVMLHVNYATLNFATQSQINNNNAISSGSQGLGALATQGGGGFGGKGFYNGGHGL